jgi:rubrerythrin
MKSQQFAPTAPDPEHEGFGLNRTGIMLNPEMSEDLIEGTKNMVSSTINDQDLSIMVDKASYLQEAIPIGSRPATNLESPADERSGSSAMAILFDKLGERLAFERQGTRLYEAFLAKLEAKGPDDAGPSSNDLRHICDEELGHFKLLQHAITQLGGDPTVQTPSADVAGVLSQGVLQIVTDPRTTIPQTLQAVLNAELADNDGWIMLADLAGKLGHSDLEEQCEKALAQEQEHLESVRSWLTAITLEEVTDANVDDERALDDAEKDAGIDKEDSGRAGRKTRKTSSSRAKSSKRRKKNRR